MDVPAPPKAEQQDASAEPVPEASTPAAEEPETPEAEAAVEMEDARDEATEATEASETPEHPITAEEDQEEPAPALENGFPTQPVSQGEEEERHEVAQ